MPKGIRGLDKVLKNVELYANNMDVELQQAMENVIEVIVTKARDLAPKDTGALRNSIVGVVKKMAGDTIQGRVEATANYAAYVELGTSDTKARPFLEPAIEEGLRILEREAQAAHKRAAKRLRKF